MGGEAVTDGAVSLRVSPGIANVGISTRDNVAALELATGREALALIKSSFVILEPRAEPLRISARHQLVGTVVRHEEGAVNDEVILDLGEGEAMTATVTRESGETLGFVIGEPT